MFVTVHLVRIAPMSNRYTFAAGATAFGSKRAFTCASGYISDGSATEWTCGTDGKWSQEKACKSCTNGLCIGGNCYINHNGECKVSTVFDKDGPTGSRPASTLRRKNSNWSRGLHGPIAWVWVWVWVSGSPMGDARMRFESLAHVRKRRGAAVANAEDSEQNTKINL